MEKIDPRTAHLRHAQYYIQVAHHAENELHLTGQVLEGLELFDHERQQIDAARAWAMLPPHREETDTLLLDFAHAAAHVGDLRYDVRREHIPHLEALLAATRRLDHRAAQGMALGNLGLAYADLGNYQRAIDFYEQPLAIAREIGGRRAEGANLGNIGLAYDSLDDPHRQLSFLNSISLLHGKLVTDRAKPML